MKISLTKLFAQDGKSEKYEIPLTSETFDRRAGLSGNRKHPVHPWTLRMKQSCDHDHRQRRPYNGDSMCKMPDTGSDSIPARVRSAD
mgnify:CR=1 FL=1